MEVDLVINDAIAQITLNNAKKHNALTKAGMAQFMHHLQEIENSARVRVLLLTGSGPKTFCSGASLEEIQAGIITSNTFQSLADRLAALPVPKVAAFNGNAYGGGVEIGLCCDFRIGLADMQVMVPAARFGLCYPLHGIQRFVHRLGPDAAKRLLVAAETISSDTLLRIGYLHRTASRNDLLEAALGWAKELACLAPLAVSAMLRICDQTANGKLDADQAAHWIMQCNNSRDLETGLKAALGRTQPQFTGE